MIIRIVALLGIALIACKSSQTNNIQEEALISMEKTRCMGACPVYKIEIYKNGKVVLDAEENLTLKGKYEAQLSDDDVSGFIVAFEERDFFGFEDSYKSNVTDLPTTYISFNYEGRSKRIMDYYNAPEELKELEKKVADLIDDLEWRKVKGN
ncbi:hypothetical protein C900_04437 [Fulvivirga imtechensis AK7]|uniref:DUF6438 domain-containing protein n=1 Tax=Fulvivirga imtechensis AK7 TaxID=1237149 RepID=L8JQY7_9BACT|nr:DUF6438 domain-containing protein [Fulvivirga imtechensis]ELR69914.1 hypothetical protein C900_04437 [Fulvivirga imtechensis AK7]